MYPLGLHVEVIVSPEGLAQDITFQAQLLGIHVSKLFNTERRINTKFKNMIAYLKPQLSLAHEKITFPCSGEK